MGFAFFCIGTIVLSFGMDFSNGLRMYKDVADEGYKIDTKRLSEIQKELYPDAAKMNIIKLLIPIFNIMHVFQKTAAYNEARNSILDQLNVMGALEEMNDLEKEEYAKKPTGFNALIVPLKIEIRELNGKQKNINTKTIKLDEGEITGEVTYVLGRSFTDIKIIKSTGEISKLSPVEQKKVILKSRIDTIEKGIKKLGAEEFEKARENNTEEYLNNDGEIPNNISEEEKVARKEAIRMLEIIKKGLLEELDKKDEEPQKRFFKKR